MVNGSTKARLAKGEMIQVRNSGIRNYQVRKHTEGHDRTPYELIWAYRKDGPVGVCWAFFASLTAAAQAAEDLVNNVRNQETGEVRA